MELLACLHTSPEREREKKKNAVISTTSGADTDDARGEARRGAARRGAARRGEARRGEESRGEERRGEARRAEARKGEKRHVFRQHQRGKLVTTTDAMLKGQRTRARTTGDDGEANDDDWRSAITTTATTFCG